MNVPHALIILQEKRVNKSLGEVQLTSGMGKVQIRRKRQSMVMARAFAPVTSKTSAKVVATSAVAESSVCALFSGCSSSQCPFR